MAVSTYISLSDSLLPTMDDLPSRSGIKIRSSSEAMWRVDCIVERPWEDRWLEQGLKPPEPRVKFKTLDEVGWSRALEGLR
jgi:hypothetical protein